jgi:hypothetical protein
MKALLWAKALCKFTQVLTQDFMTAVGARTPKEKEEIDTKLDKHLGLLSDSSMQPERRLFEVA